jgi:hypothetical protein
MIFYIWQAQIIFLMQRKSRRGRFHTLFLPLGSALGRCRIDPDRNQPVSSTVLHAHPNAVQAGVLGGVQKIQCKASHSPSFRETDLSSSRRRKSREVEINLSGGDLQRNRGFPLAREFCVPRERAGVQNCLRLGSPVAGFQVFAATWRFWFFCLRFHIY